MSRPKTRPDGFPTRASMGHWTSAEWVINAAVQAVERMGAHPLLTDAVILLGEAQTKIADFAELPETEIPPP